MSPFLAIGLQIVRTSIVHRTGTKHKETATRCSNTAVSMGARTSHPKVHQKKVLRKNYEKLCQAAAKYIHDADVLVLCTGAGFSADSGLAVYIDIAKIPAYAQKELEYYDLCKPHWLESDPDIFYGFWGQCFNDYKKTQPHEGYEIIANWKNQKNQPVETNKDNKPGRSYYKGSLAKRIEARLAKVDRNSHDTSGPYDVNGIAGAFYLFTSNVDAHSFDYFQVNNE